MEPLYFQKDPEKQDKLAQTFRKVMESHITEKLTDEAKKNIKTATGGTTQSGGKRFKATKALIKLAKSNAKNFVTKEEQEFIDELNTSTLKSYVAKASDNAAAKKSAGKTAKLSSYGNASNGKKPDRKLYAHGNKLQTQASTRSQNVTLAKEKIAKKEKVSEEVLEAKEDNRNQAEADAGQKSVPYKRPKGMGLMGIKKKPELNKIEPGSGFRQQIKDIEQKRKDRAMKEEQDFINELNTSTLASYAKKASVDAAAKTAAGKSAEKASYGQVTNGVVVKKPNATLYAAGNKLQTQGSTRSQNVTLAKEKIAKKEAAN